MIYQILEESNIIRLSIAGNPIGNAGIEKFV